MNNIVFNLNKLMSYLGNQSFGVENIAGQLMNANISNSTLCNATIQNLNLDSITNNISTYTNETIITISNSNNIASVNTNVAGTTVILPPLAQSIGRTLIFNVASLGGPVPTANLILQTNSASEFIGATGSLGPSGTPFIVYDPTSSSVGDYVTIVGGTSSRWFIIGNS